MVSDQRDDVRFIVNNEYSVGGCRGCSHDMKLSAAAIQRQLVACHEHVTITLHSLSARRAASFANPHHQMSILIRVRSIVACVAAVGTAACASTQLAPSGQPVDLVIATTTDVHGRITAWDYYANRAETVRGLTRAATIVDSVRAANPGRVILLDAGDLLQGNPLAYVAARISANRTNPIIATMNAMRYDAAAIGNHEYNYGVPYLDSAIHQATFPFLSANTYRVDPAGVHAYQSWTIVERAGLKVGIIGATTPGVMVWDAENIRGKLRFGDIVPAVRAAVREVRAAGADVLIVTVHSGLNEPSSYDTVTTGVPSENVAARVAREIPGIDLVLYGHSHKEVRGMMIGQTLLIQPKNWATSVAVAHIGLTRTGGRWVVGQKSSDIVL